MQTPQVFKPIPAGSMPGDQSVEIFGDRTSKEVFYFKDGQTHKFETLPQTYKTQLLKRLLSDKIAMKQLGHLGYTEALKRFAFCHYGSIDNIADFCKDGKLGQSDNFRCGENCTCLKWQSKNITTEDGQRITPRQLQIIDLLRKGLPDKQIAHILGICISTVDNHKTAIMHKLKAYSKVDIITKSINQNIIN